MVYGIDTSKDTFKFKRDASSIFLKNTFFKIKDGETEYLGFAATNELNPDSVETADIFVENYDMWNGFDGLEALIADTINELEFGGELVFTYEDYILGVTAYIPEDEEDIKNYPTQKRIREIFAEYVNPLLEEPVTINWFDEKGM